MKAYQSALALGLLALLSLSGLPSRAQESPGKTLESWITRSQVEAPEIHGNLAIYPIDSEPGKIPSVQTLDKASSAGDLRISELGGGSVNTLVVENRGKQPVFIMAGEILSGAKQDRILQHDLWLPAQSGKVEVSCYCVEHGRWHYTGAEQEFHSKSTMANLQVRADGRAEKSQGAVWDSVNQTQMRAGYAAPTNSLNAAYEDKKTREKVEDLATPMADLVSRHPKMLGAVVQVGDELMAADCFSDRHVLAELWPKLVKSYALEASSRSKATPSAKTEAARRFLLQAAAADPTRTSTPGQGTLLELRSASVSGEALLVGDEGLAHLELFNRGGKTPIRDDVPPIYRHY